MSNSHYQGLRDKWVERHRSNQKSLWEKHGDSLKWFSNNLKQFAVGSVGGMLLLTAPPTLPLLSSPISFASENVAKQINKSAFVISDLASVLPKEMQPLTPDEEQKTIEILSRTYDLPIKAEIDGKRLNRNYGFIGAEQHLSRYPGDTMPTHLDTQDDAAQYYSSGMAPGLGAWGYFSSSASSMTEKDNLREKYYIAVQTFLSDNFNERFGEYRDFFKYRKVLVVNPQNGKAVVADIADAGPAVWTGKHLGGSPEVMKYLEREDGARRGPVLYFFIDDPNDKIPLGPLLR